MRSAAFRVNSAGSEDEDCSHAGAGGHNSASNFKNPADAG